MLWASGVLHCEGTFYGLAYANSIYELHLVLEVKDDGVPCLYSYKRVVIRVTNAKLLGGRDRAFETTMESLEH